MRQTVFFFLKIVKKRKIPICTKLYIMYNLIKKKTNQKPYNICFLNL